MKLEIIGLFGRELTEEIRALQKAMVESGVSAHTYQLITGPHMTFFGYETGSAVRAIESAKQLI